MPPNIDQLGLDDGTKLGALLRRFYPLLIERAYADADTVLDVGLSFDLDNPDVQRVLGALAQQIADITETTKADVQSLIGKQASEGWNLSELAQALRARGVTESARRAELIAATETAGAYSRGSLLAYAESGVVAKVEWLTADSPCPICDPLNGKQVKLGESFGDIDHPPAHPLCRCAIAPIIG